MAKLLLELFSEEIPARMQARAAEDLRRLFVEGLRAAGILFATTAVFATPRRLALAVDGLPQRSPDTREERRGPRVGAPQQAIDGFLKSVGLKTLDQCEKRDTGKGEFWFAFVEKKGRDAADVAREIVGKVISDFPWPKSMRWGGHQLAWVRPLHHILCVFDGKALGGGLVEHRADSPDSYFGGTSGGASSRFVFAPAPRPEHVVVPASETTRGHRFLAPGEIRVESYADYARKLRQAFVILDAEERKAVIRTRAETLCREAGVDLIKDEALFDEVAGLVEWPVPLMGSIDREFMDVPAEVLITSMKTHQRYFACLTRGGDLAPRFVVVANTIATDGGREIVAGNERVLRARLSDAKFFWEQDKKTTLEQRLPALKDIVFHAKLGTQAERVERIARLAVDIVGAERSSYCAGTDRARVDTAARLCKADLVSGMVGEFPELQGTMGRYYARHEGLPSIVAEAIGEHYSPVGPTDRCPTAPVAVAVALADKIDVLAGFWAIDEKPTGSKDPYALRRAALGVIRLIVENRLRLPLAAVIAGHLRARDEAGAAIGEGAAGFPDSTPDRASGLPVATVPVGAVPAPVADLLNFFAERLKVQAREQGVRHDLVNAVFATGGEDDLVRLLARVKALQAFVEGEDGKNLLVAYNRAASIVKAELRKEKGLAAAIAGAPDATRFAQDEERALDAALGSAGASAATALKAEDYATAMTGLSGLRAPLDAFFEKVTVNVADDAGLRLNRLKLLNRIRATIDGVADFARIEG